MSAMQAASRKGNRLPTECSRILYVRNLPYKIDNEEMYDIFGKYGAIRQVRIGKLLEKFYLLKVFKSKLCTIR